MLALGVDHHIIFVVNGLPYIIKDLLEVTTQSFPVSFLSPTQEVGKNNIKMCLPSPPRQQQQRLKKRPKKFRLMHTHLTCSYILYMYHKNPQNCAHFLFFFNFIGANFRQSYENQAYFGMTSFFAVSYEI